MDGLRGFGERVKLGSAWKTSLNSVRQPPTPADKQKKTTKKSESIKKKKKKSAKKSAEGTRKINLPF